MEISSCLWSYDNRWMFELKFSKIGWILPSVFQFLILTTTIFMGFYSSDMKAWVGFRILVSLGLFLSCLILAVLHENQNKKKKFCGYFELFVGLLGILNLALTLPLCFHQETERIFTSLADLQIFLYFAAVAPLFVTVLGYFFVKIGYLIMALICPMRFVKVKFRN